MVGHMQKLERLGLADPIGPAGWRLSENAEPTLRALGERSDIIKRIHRGLTEQRIERSVADYAFDGGAYRQRFDLASGRFAMIDDGLGFSLVHWSPSLERHLGHHVSGSARSRSVVWSFGKGPTVG